MSWVARVVEGGTVAACGARAARGPGGTWRRGVQRRHAVQGRHRHDPGCRAAVVAAHFAVLHGEGNRGGRRHQQVGPSSFSDW
jgi:hypothetical protein